MAIFNYKPNIDFYFFFFLGMEGEFSVGVGASSPVKPSRVQHYLYKRPRTDLGPNVDPLTESLDENSNQISLEEIRSSMEEITGFLRKIAENTQPADSRKSAPRTNNKEKVSF